jgi:hypothetical protein
MPQHRVEREKIVLWPRLGDAWWVAPLPLPALGFAVWMAARGEWAVAALLFGCFALLGGLVYAVLSPRATSLELRRDGIEMRVMGRRARRFLWSDIEDFARVSGKGGASVGWLLREGVPGRRSEAGRQLVGADITLPVYLCGEPGETETLLRAARAAALGDAWPAFLASRR